MLSDAAIVNAALAVPLNIAALQAVQGFGPRVHRRQLELWLAAVERARAIPEAQLPPPSAPHEGPPPPRAWAEKDPVAAARLSGARAAVSELAEKHSMPPENLITPDLVRRVSWEPPAAPTAQNVAAVLRGLGARQWQVDLVAPVVAAAFVKAATEPAPEPATDPGAPSA